MAKHPVVTLFRLLFGLHFLFNGLNYAFNFFEIPKPPGEMANVLHDAMVVSGMFGIAKGVEILSGLMLLTNFYTPLALILAFPVTVVILFVDVWLTGRALYAGAGIVTFLLNAGLMLAYLPYYRPMLARASEPGLLAGPKA